MKLIINSHGIVGVLGVPDSLRGSIKHWFGARGAPSGVMIIPTHKVWAFIGHYQCEIDPKLTAWLDEAYSANQVIRRVAPHIRAWRGGYQAKIVAQSVDRRAQALFARYGSGKTNMILEIARQTGPTLLVVPPLIWQNAYISDNPENRGDLKRFYRGMKYVEAMGSANRDERIGKMRHPADLYAVSSNIIESMVQELLDVPLATIAVDESTMMKNQKTALYRALKKLRHKARFRIVASGDMSPNDISDLWAQIDFLDPTIFGKWKDFCAEYGERDESGWNWVFEDQRKNLEALNLLRSERIVTFLDEKSFYQERKEPIVRAVEVKLPEVQMQAYRAMRDHMRFRVNDSESIDARSRIENVMKLRQIAAGFVYDEAGNAKQIIRTPAKIVALKQLATQRAPYGFRGEQAIIWCQFAFEYELVQRALAQLRISSGILRSQDSASMQALEEFTERRIRCLITHQKTAAHGIRLHMARHSVWMSLDWSSEGFDQARARTDRPPQAHQCYFWLMVAKGTIDEDILASLEGRIHWRNIVHRVLGSRVTITDKMLEQEKMNERTPSLDPETRPRRRIG